jgi:hypothetical protein
MVCVSVCLGSGAWCPAQDSVDAWSAPAYRYRTRIDVDAGGFTRWDKPVEVALDFSRLLRQIDVSRFVDPARLALFETHPGGILPIAHQFDRDPDFHPWTDARGTLTFMLSGITPPPGRRSFFLYFGVERGATPDPAPPGIPRVTVDRLDYRGQESFHIQSTRGDYIYHRAGAGFASLIDSDGLDWLSYHPGVGARSNSGSGGEYRGIPNMGHPEGYCHPGHSVSRSELLSSGPLKITVASQSLDGHMSCRWDIFPFYARMTVLAMRKPFWFLYEGTPGGSLDMDTDLCVRPGPEGIITTPVRDRWEGDLPSSDGCEWLYFCDPDKKRSLYLVHHQDDEAVDSYWPMNEEMTVFGFGRLGIKKFMHEVPCTFTIGLCEGIEPMRVREWLQSAVQPLTVDVGPLDVKP